MFTGSRTGKDTATPQQLSPAKGMLIKEALAVCEVVFDVVLSSNALLDHWEAGDHFVIGARLALAVPARRPERSDPRSLVESIALGGVPEVIAIGSTNYYAVYDIIY